MQLQKMIFLVSKLLEIKMKQIIQLLILFSLISVSVTAQSNDYSLNMKLIITPPDTQMIILNHRDKMDELIEGYYRISRYDDPFYGQNAGLQPGGFSFLDSEVFGGMVEVLSEKWIKNKFPMEDVASMTNGMDVQKAVSFQIKPVVVDIESDTLNLLIKYAIYDFSEQKDYNLDYNYNVKLFYKLVHVQYGNEITFDFISEQFKDHKITFCFTKNKIGEEYYAIKDDSSLFDEIQKSVSESKLANTNFNFDIELIRFDEAVMNVITPIAKYKEQNLPFAKEITNIGTSQKTELSTKIYYSKLTFPFILYNEQKEELYKNYKSKESIFQSTCNVIIVPIEKVNDSLTIDLFVNYSKLNLSDGIPRWTPIKKRLTIDNNWRATSITLPKENWSASFERNSEQYDIYGYSDFERFVKEQLYIKYELLNEKG